MSQHPFALPAVPILMYHSVSSQSSSRFRQFTVSPDLFSEHLSYLEHNHYTPLTVTQFAETMSNPALLPARPVILTFDDGFADFLSNALPQLKRLGFCATLYIATAFVGKTSLWLRHEFETARAMLNWDDILEISQNGVECAAHTRHHLQLDTLPPDVARNEIVNCKIDLEEHLPVTVASFAYPYGYFRSVTQQLVRAAGYTSACAVRFAFSSASDDRFALARLAVTADTTIDDFARLLRYPGPTHRVFLRHVRTKIWQFLRCSVAQFLRAMPGPFGV